ncbi:terpene synthase family protein [Nocardia thraciensis]
MTESLTTADCGIACATAVRLRQSMTRWAAAYPVLYDHEPFGSALFGSTALAIAFSAPRSPPDRLNAAARATLWIHGLDWLMDSSELPDAAVHDLMQGCMRVATDNRTDTPPPLPLPAAELTTLLAELRDDLIAAPAFRTLRQHWSAALRRLLAAMKQERQWATDGDSDVRQPSLRTYLDNADSVAVSFVFTTHWIANGGGGDIDAIVAASAATQRVIRLINDLATVARDIRTGDTNALFAATSRDEIDRLLGDLERDADAKLRTASRSNPELTDYMRRQWEFCHAFYSRGDLFWNHTDPAATTSPTDMPSPVEVPDGEPSAHSRPASARP